MAVAKSRDEIAAAYDSPPWWYDVRGFLILTFAYNSTITHQLRVEGREVSLERRRALEPLVVQLLRRAREGLSAEEILRAAGGPGPESADAEHRVRVLISRVRDLLGDPAAIERVRDAGEHGKTRYRLSPGVRFALVEPLYQS